VRLGGLIQLKISTGTRTRNLPACSIVPQSTTLPRAPSLIKRDIPEMEMKNKTFNGKLFSLLVIFFHLFSNLYRINTIM
jgi:hypothetical protein